MAVDPTQLSQTDKQHLAALAEKTGDEAVREAVKAFLERSAEQAEPNRAPSTEQTRPILGSLRRHHERRAAGGY